MKRNADVVWALVTDGGFGRLVQLERSPSRMTELLTRESETRHLTRREIASSSSGRDFDATGPVSHTKPPRSDPHDAAEADFAGAWVEYLESALEQGRFEHLLVVADPRTLGRLRTRMSAHLANTVSAEQGRDLVKLSPKALEQRLRSLAGWPE